MTPHDPVDDRSIEAIEQRLQERGLGREAVAEALAALAPHAGSAAGARLQAVLSQLHDPRGAYDRLAALFEASRQAGDPGEARARVLALVELAAAPDFDVDLLRPWIATFRNLVGEPRRLREEAAWLLLLFATGADEAERALAAARCLALLKATPRGLDWSLAALCLLLNATYARDLALADWLLRQPAIDDVSRQLDTLRALRWYEALADWHFVERRPDASIAANAAAAERAEADGLPDRARACRIGIAMAWLSERRIDEARAAIAAYTPLPDGAPPVQAVYAAGNLGWLARLERRWIDVEAHSRRAAELAVYAGMPALEQGVVMLQHARALLTLGRYPEVLAVFDQAAPLMQGRWVARLRADRLLIEALQQLDAGHTAEARRLARTGLDDHFAQSAPNLLDQTDEAAARIVALGLANGMHGEALRDLVGTRRLLPPREADVHWPWALRIWLFDGFRIEGLAPVAAEARQRADSKPTQILQYLAAHAPAPVPAQRLADALWPESEGDRAMRSLDVALTRLRAQLPDAGLIQRNEGRIGFDTTRVWCDTGAALQLVQQLREHDHRRQAAPGGAALFAEQSERALGLLALYRGPLLADSREPFARDRAAHFSGQIAGALQIGLRAAIRLDDPAAAEEMVRLSVAQGLPGDLVRSVIGELQAEGERSARRAGQLGTVFDLARR